MSTPSAILIVRTSAFGDIIHTFPVTAFLRKRFPKAQIDWVVEQPAAELVRANPHVSSVIPIYTKAWRADPFSRKTWKDIYSFKNYDVVFDVQSNLKSGLIAWLADSPIKVGFGWETAHERTNPLFTNKRYNPPKGKNIREEYLFLIQSFFNDFSEQDINEDIPLILNHEQKEQLKQLLEKPLLKNKRCVMVCPGSHWPNKQLPLPILEQFLQKINEELPCTFLFIWGTDAEHRVAESLRDKFKHHSLILPKVPLPVLQHMMRAMDLIISMDSLPLHLAGTTATPTFSFFGPSSRSKYAPSGSHHRGIQGDCPYGRTFEKRCPILRTCKTGTCIRGLDVNQIFEKLMNKESENNETQRTQR